MLKAVVMIVSGVIAFVAVFAFTARDEIAAEAANRLDSDFAKQCAARAQFPAEVEHRKEEICGCMKFEFDKRGIAIGDALGSRRAEMQEITQDCMLVYR